MSEEYYSITENQSKRLNIMKFLLSIFVVYIHSSQNEVKFASEIIELNFPNWFENYVYLFSQIIPRCAVGGFFLMSSFFLYRKKFTWKDNMKKRLKTLLLPYIIMNTFWIIAFAIAQTIPQTKMFFNNPSNIIVNFNFYRWLQAFGIGSNPFLYPLWFVRNLLILNALAIIIKIIIDKLPKISLLIVCIMYLFLPMFPFNDFCTLFSVTDLCMWCFGYFIIKFNWDLNKLDNKKWILYSYILIVIIRIIFKNTDIPVFSLLIYRTSLIISIIFWYSWFTYYLNGKIQKIFIKFSCFNFGIYIFHEMILSISKKLIAKIIGTQFIIQFLQYIFLPIIIIIIVILFCIILKKRAPKLFSILMGSRI